MPDLCLCRYSMYRRPQGDLIATTFVTRELVTLAKNHFGAASCLRRAQHRAACAKGKARLGAAHPRTQ
jgi:hypothetical protein